MALAPLCHPLYGEVWLARCTQYGSGRDTSFLLVYAFDGCIREITMTIWLMESLLKCAKTIPEGAAEKCLPER